MQRYHDWHHLALCHGHQCEYCYRARPSGCRARIWFFQLPAVFLWFTGISLVIGGGLGGAMIGWLNANREALHTLGCVTLAKPFDIDELLQAVATALDAQRRDRAVSA